MSRRLSHFCFIVLVALLIGCGQFNFPVDLPTSGQTGGLTNAEVIEGLKEALVLGAQKSTAQASKTDGFFKNPQLFLPFPQEAIEAKNVLESAGLNQIVDDFVLSLNRAAEDAAKRALPIFKEAIIGMSITDAMGILKGADNAATEFLKSRTYTKLVDEFKPEVKKAVAAAKVASYWNPVVTNYNRLTILTGGAQINPNLEDYITQKTIDGIFILVAKEEGLIRKDPAARATELLKKVFANQ
jgi:hypothetical protein